MFEKENAFYNAHKEEFHKRYPTKQLVIVGEALIGIYDTPKDALTDALKHFKPGGFMMRSPANDDKRLKIGPIIRI
ncbi:hypothetical protein AGMMS49928_16200 [Spirochaetia bacterium]|nr:hypothetical protein AGMMS49928_16200 [Spirochaetia bacterium]